MQALLLSFGDDSRYPMPRKQKPTVAVGCFLTFAWVGFPFTRSTKLAPVGDKSALISPTARKDNKESLNMQVKERRQSHYGSAILRTDVLIKACL